MTAVDVETLDLTDLDWDHQPVCEHSTHEIQLDRHDGPAKWLQTYTEPLFCGHTGSTVLYVCDAWMRYAIQAEWFRCRECNVPVPNNLSFTPIH